MLLGLLGGAVPAGAQTVRGTLVEEGTELPIAGAFVILEDSAGQALASTLTGSAGTWLLRAPTAGTYRLRADRIGYASSLSDALVLEEGQSVSYRLAAAVAPVGLTELAVEGADSRCEVLGEEGLAVYRVWEEARKALAAIVWTGQQPYYRFDAVHYQRQLDAAGLPASDVEYEEVRYFGRHPFRSIPTRDLVLGGFVQRISGVVQYYGPDADVMLSDAFLLRHCFKLVETDLPGLVGLEFEPVDESRTIDISGTMWLDTETSELRSLDFTYENLELPVDYAPAGRVGGVRSTALGRVDRAALGHPRADHRDRPPPHLRGSHASTAASAGRNRRRRWAGHRGVPDEPVGRLRLDRHPTGTASCRLPDRPVSRCANEPFLAFPAYLRA